MSKVLITGGAGFIGFHLATRLLQEGHEIVLIDNFSRGVSDPDLEHLCHSGKIRLQKMDLLKDDLSSLDTDFEYVFHLAAIIGVEHVLKRPFEVLSWNTEMLLKIIDFSRSQKGLKRLVFSSTSEVYAGTLKYFDLQVPTPEDTPLTVLDLSHPRTSYMLSKIYGEAIIHQSGIPFMIIRPHNFYGPRMGMAHVIPQQLQKIYRAEDGDSIEVYSPSHKRTFCYIEDAVDMIYKLCSTDKTIGETFNIGNETPEICIRDLVKKLITVVGRDVTIREMENTPGSPARRAPSMKKVESFITRKESISLVEGVQKTYDWYRDRIFVENQKCAE